MPTRIPPRWPDALQTRCRPVAAAAGLLIFSASIHAQTQAPGPAPEASTPAATPAATTAPAAPLRASEQLQETPDPAGRRASATILRGDLVTGRPDLDTVVDGNAELRRRDILIRADRIEYWQPDDLARARGNVQINRGGNVYEGPLLELKVDAFEGFFVNPNFRLLANGAHGEADRVDFIDADRAHIRNGTYTTCERRPGPSWLPDWVIKASSIHIDNATQTGRASDGRLQFKGVTLLALPEIGFPLGDQRRSGFLPPTVGLDTLSGLEVSVPYYWNIAPNRDATLYPTLLTRRGVDLGGEFRYLEPLYTGKLRANLLPNDRLRDRTRWGASYQHSGVLATGWPGLGNLGLGVNLNRVSDDNYWRDFPRATTTLAQRLLPNDGILNWAAGDLSATVRALKWQTLQDVTNPITPPYDRLPQTVLRYVRADLGGFDVHLEADHTRFQGERALTGQPNASRSFALGHISRPWITPGSFVTPRLQLHATRYSFDASLGTGQSSAQRVLPTFSVDSGLIYERDAQFFGRTVRQTLEPRAFYVYTPFRAQNHLPNYDSAANDFNFATVFTENAFGGHDRISDNNLLTAGLTSRLLEPATGAEIVRLGVAQRFRFKDQLVTLPGGTPVSERLSDILLGAAVNWSPQWGVDATVQYNPKTQRSIRNTFAARYSPGPYRVFNATYRLQRDVSEQIDVGWQWPINDLWRQPDSDGAGAGRGLGEGRWYSVGRLNYSRRDRKLVDAIVGIEYDGGCWVGRAVLERLQRSNTSSHQRVLLQLEFIGFTRLGTNPLQTLRNNIPRYQLLREQTQTPSRFGQYE